MSKKRYEQWKQGIIATAKEKKIPVTAQFELTVRCNLDCKMCYVHNLDPAYCRAHELSTDEWKRIFDEAYENELLFAVLTGGECLLRQDFKELYLYLWKKGIKVTVLTNGTLLDSEYIAFFKTYKPEMIQISLYGSDEAGYLRVTGHQGFGKAVGAVRGLMDAGVNVRVVITPSRYMGDDYMNILRYCKEHGLPLQLTELMLFPNRDDPTKDDYYLSMEEIAELAINRASFYKSLTPCKCTPEPFGPMTQPPKKGLTCNGGNCVASVMWDGVMYPCPNAMVGGGASLCKMSYEEAWKHTVNAASEVIQGIECEGCPYEKLCPKCPTLRLTALDSGHCNPDICKMTRLLVEEGVKKLSDVDQSSATNEMIHDLI